MDTRPLARSPRTNWVEKAGGLPPYTRAIARGVARKDGGKVTSKHIAIAIAATKKYVRSKKVAVAKRAVKAAAQWEAAKQSRHVR